MRAPPAMVAVVIALALLVVPATLAGATAETKPTITPLDLAVSGNDIAVAANESTQVQLTLRAQMECGVGFEPPNEFSGQIVAFEKGGKDWAREPLLARWHSSDQASNTYVLFERVSFMVPPADVDATPGRHEVTVQVLPDPVTPSPGRCQPDGYRVEGGETTFDVTIVPAESDEGALAQAVEANRQLEVLPMVLAVGLVGLLVLFAVLRERARKQ